MPTKLAVPANDCPQAQCMEDTPSQSASTALKACHLRSSLHIPYPPAGSINLSSGKRHKPASILYPCCCSSAKQILMPNAEAEKQGCENLRSNHEYEEALSSVSWYPNNSTVARQSQILSSQSNGSTTCTAEEAMQMSSNPSKWSTDRQQA